MSETDVRLKQLRLIQIGLIVVISIFAWVAEIGRGPGGGEWTWRQWLVAGLALWSISSGITLRRRISKRSAELSSQSQRGEKVIRLWRSGQLMNLWIAASVALWGLVVRMALRGALWQAAVFYASGFFLLLLWTPQRPVENS